MSINNTPLSNQIERNMRDLAMLGRVTFPRPQRTRIITVANQKGGVGETTSAINLAAGLTMGGLSVLTVGTDTQGNASGALGVPHPAGTPSTCDIVIGDTSTADIVQPCPDIDNVVVCPATIGLSGAEIESVDAKRRKYRLCEVLREHVSEHVDINIVFIDCSPSLDLVTLNVTVATDEVMILTQVEHYALEDLSQLWNTIGRIGVGLNPGLRVSSMLLAMADKRTKLSEEIGSEVRSHFPDHTFETVVPRSVRIPEVPSYGQTVVTYDPRNVGAIAYRKAALELCQRVAASEERLFHMEHSAFSVCFLRPARISYRV